MKRLLGLAVLFVVLCMCVPSSYGTSGNYFLIYNVSCTVKGVNNDTKASIPLKAYYVVNLDSGDNLVDANLIMYGKDSSKNKVYIELDHDANVPYKLLEDYWWQDKGDFAVFDIWDYNTPFDFEGLVVGLSAPKDIGLGTNNKKWVASSMTGPMMIWGDMLFDPDDDIAGGGTISASLDLKTTKLVNQNHWTEDQIINGTGGLIQKLRGYSPATLPPP